MDNTLSWYLWLEAFRETSALSDQIAVMKIDDDWMKRQIMRIGHFNSMTMASSKKISYHEPALRFYKNPKEFMGIEVLTEPGQWALIELMACEINELQPVSGIVFTSIDFYNGGLVCCGANIQNTKTRITTDSLYLTDIMDQYEILQNGGFGTSGMF